jgi:pyruvate/2-oxoglutarate dehydrogenase complex dihydrolipoamide dehydrogenase (E3) component
MCADRRQERAMAQHFDAAIIGAGQAGPSLANRLSQAGRTVAIIERKHFGGTCVNTGCMPTKTLVASAYAARLVARAGDYGIAIDGPVTVDMRKVKARKDAVVNTARTNVEAWLRGMQNCTVMTGHARFVSPREIAVDGEALTADHIFINVGGRPLVPSIPGIEQVGALTNETVMDLDAVPRHLIVLGGSYIGLEFAQVFRRFGSAVTVIEAADRLVPREDDEVSAGIKDILEREQIDIQLASRCRSLARTAAGIVARIDTPAGPADVTGSHLLLAIGRVPNTDHLGLAEAGVTVDARGFIPVDDELRTNVPSIFALGDCNGRGAFTHTSYNDYEIVAANLLDGGRRRVSDRIATYALFIDPPLGRVGMTEREARAAGKHLLVGRRPMTRVGRAVEKGETLGFMKVLVDADTRRILGAAILGTGGDEAIHSIVDTMYADAPYTTLQRAVHIHPTVAELIPTMLGEMMPGGGAVTRPGRQQQ